ncbi:hypothetical protein L6164_037173 [Bauhinia variegata]|uniref:Uncharacterized protein n=1 Tax=Bauhinia variegata TaxID=167791 RepID=A0ACB9KJC6_BAUVA|nr:hypothetical protein L6164_037173 [Bauhinia variegata]
MAAGSDSIMFYTLFFLALLIFTLLFMSSTKPGVTRIQTLPSPPALPIIGHLHHLMGLTMHKSFQNLARLYGPLLQLRLGASTCVVVSNAQVAREVMKTHELNFSYRPLFGSNDYNQYKDSYFITAPYGPYWRFLKKLCVTRLHSNSRLGHLMHIREQEIKKLLEFLMMCSREGRACDLSVQLTALTNNIICRMAMSTSRVGEDNDANLVHLLIEEYVELGGKLSVGEVLGPLGKLDLFGYGRRLQKVVAKFDQVVERIMKEHEENNEEHARDMMDILLQVYRDPNAESRLTRNDIKAFFQEIFLAGTDTTSKTLLWIMAEIISHPHVLNNLRAEIDPVVGSTRLDFTYIPFGRGRRGCPGESLALIVMHATVASLIQCFDWKIDGGDKVDMEEGSGFAVGLAKPLVVYPITRFSPF